MADVRPVAASEYELVALARALIAAQPGEAQALWQHKRALPPAISSACEAMLGDALAQVWPALWRRGGTAPEPGGPGEPGRRIWQRHAPVGLAFSLATLRLLRWLLAAPPIASPRLEAMPLTIGDQVMIYLALDAAAGSPAQPAIAAQPLVRAAPLAWLGFAELLGDWPGLALDGLCRGSGAIVVEALAGELARRWRAVELAKRAAVEPAALIALGAAQDGVLGGFLAACDREHRRDLAGFVIDAAAPLLARGIAPMPVRLSPVATLASRSEARVAGGALLRAVATWSAWDQAHRGVRFFDDDYAEAQRLLARFEPIAATGAARAAAWLAELAALSPGPLTDASTTAADAAATVEPP